MSSAIFRMLSFERLGLNHTCECNALSGVRGYYLHGSLEGRKFIEEADVEDAKLLDVLVAEFETVWATYDQPFATFIQKRWKPRMEKFRKSKRTKEDSYRAEAARLGIEPEYPDWLEYNGVWSSEDEHSTDEEDEVYESCEEG